MKFCPIYNENEKTSYQNEDENKNSVPNLFNFF